MGASLGLGAVRRRIAPSLEQEGGVILRLAFGGSGSLLCLLLSGPWLGTGPGFHAIESEIPSTYGAVFACLFLVDWSVRTAPNRSERVSLGQAIWAGVLAFVIASLLGGVPVLAAGVLAGVSLAIQAAETVERTVRQLGLTELVEVTRTSKELDPARRYLGRWQATYEGETVEITVRERSRCTVAADDRTTALPWSFEAEENRIRIRRRNDMLYGHIDSKGNLIVEGMKQDTPITFKKID